MHRTVGISTVFN